MSWIKDWKERAKVRKWNKMGRPAPPPHSIKQEVLRSHAREYGLKVFVETGTLAGDMIAAMHEHFEKLYSVELATRYYEAAVRRFSGDPKVKIIQGDSGEVLKDLVPQLDGPTLFWLDGHYSGGDTARGDEDTPVMEELKHIFSRNDLPCIVIIDDARCFGEGGEDSYPALDVIENYVSEVRPGWAIEVENDSIRITPQKM